jgi:hypothetical protein
MLTPVIRNRNLMPCPVFLILYLVQKPVFLQLRIKKVPVPVTCILVLVSKCIGELNTLQ